MLYIVATPIGNLSDISFRAIDILNQVDLILAEDTRTTSILLQHYKIKKTLASYHQYNEREKTMTIIQQLKQGLNIALVSDAGTPLISDPGFDLVTACINHGIKVSPIPGPSALTTALTVAGLPCDEFIFYGFLNKQSGKQTALSLLAQENRTIVLFEAASRLIATLQDLKQHFGAERKITLCRELTKKFETIKHSTISGVLDFVKQDFTNQTKGEIVLIIAGASDTNTQLDEATRKLAHILAKELPPTKAASIAAKISGLPKKILYEYILSLVG